MRRKNVAIFVGSGVSEATNLFSVDDVALATTPVDLRKIRAKNCDQIGRKRLPDFFTDSAMSQRRIFRPILLSKLLIRFDSLWGISLSSPPRLNFPGGESCKRAAAAGDFFPNGSFCEL